MVTDTRATFFAGAADRGATVIVLGRLLPSEWVMLSGSIQPTGILVACSPAPPARFDGVQAVRAAFSAVPVLSHVADLVVLSGMPALDLDALAGEIRRLLAPRGSLRASIPASRLARFIDVARAADLRDIETTPLPGTIGVRARGPR
jgi:hypothetical protein